MEGALSFGSFFSRHQVGMAVSINEFCPNELFFLGKAASWPPYDGLDFVPAPPEQTSWDEETEEEEEEDVVVVEDLPPTPSRPPKPGKWWQRALAFVCCCYEVDY